MLGSMEEGHVKESAANQGRKCAHLDITCPSLTTPSLFSLLFPSDNRVFLKLPIKKAVFRQLALMCL